MRKKLTLHQVLTRKPSIRPVILLFIAILVLGFFTSHATMTLDPPARFQLTRSIVDFRDMQIRLDENDPDIMARYAIERFQGPDGNYYLAFFGIGQAITFIPHYIILHHIMGIDSEPLMLAAISATLFPLTLALTALVFYALMREFGFHRRQCYIIAALVVLATSLWQVSKECQEDSQLALYFALTALTLKRYQNHGKFEMMIFSALIMGFSFLTRSDIAPTILFYTIFATYLIYQNHQCRTPTGLKRRLTVIHLLPVLTILFVVLLVHLYIEYSHYGKLFSSWDVPFSLSHLSLGLPGLLYSPGKGMFLFNPFFLLSIIGLIPLWRAHREWALFVLAAFLGCLFLHAMLTSFHGNWCWGPRYLCRQIPLLFIPLAFFVWKPNAAQ
ncbi:MAG: hypothetical protein GY869_06460, partial [Planctomycetes bacterium]|nr:hypothetical protein [Planctomycetota bacterium]